MRPFIHPDFLLHSEAARELYHRYAAPEPIFDYHNHLPPAQIAANHTFANLTELWLAGDHYKWRALRALGVPERLITGDASPREKFDAWVGAVPALLRNPLFHWSYLELARYLDYRGPIDAAHANEIWVRAEERLPELQVHTLLKKSRVLVLGTTDDPADPLDEHLRIQKLDITTRVYPTFRPDRALAVRSPEAFNAWVERLAVAARQPIGTFAQFLEALERRHADFHAVGARLSDHGLEAALAWPCTTEEAAAVFAAARAGRVVSPEEAERYGAYLMREFGRWNARRGWTQQLHLGALRNNNQRLLRQVGADCGCDTIGDQPQARALAAYLDSLDSTGELPRLVLYNLNPADNYVFAALAGTFQDGSRAGKIQFGSGWWFLDQKEGIEWQLNALSQLGVLSRFVGMLTDSRSFLSFPRHEYFRRVFCNLLGAEMERGELPHDFALVGELVRRVCFANARDFFELELP